MAMCAFAACARGAAQAPPGATTPVQPAGVGRTASRAVPIPAGWMGSYICRQGVTGLQLDIAEVPQDHFKCHNGYPDCDPDFATAPVPVRATFKFFPLPENPDLPAGSFTMTGVFTARKASLKPEAWKEQPAGWEMVALSGEVSDDNRFFRGTIEHEGCGAFGLSLMATQ
jgi:hypothetical protein